MKKICIVVSAPMTVKAFLLKHIEILSQEYQITVVSNSTLDLGKEYQVQCLSKYIPIDRKINVLEDVKSVVQLYEFLKKEKFDLVLSVSPKAGLVSSIASFLAGIKYRIHFFTGQVWVTKKGIFRIILKRMDKLIGKLNTHNLVDSPSQSKFLILENVLKNNNSNVLLSGSISGVDVIKFSKNEQLKYSLQKKYNLNNDDIIFMFIGRLNTDKGVLDLVRVFETLFERYKHVKLFLIGPDEENIEKEIHSFLNHERIIRLDYVSHPEEILNIADVLVLPSYREGFGTIVIEAAAMGIPSIASNIYGLKDAVIDNFTGLLHNVKDCDDMIKKYEYLINNPKLIEEFGKNAQERIYNEFKDEDISKALKKYVNELVKND